MALLLLFFAREDDAEEKESKDRYVSYELSR
jgi:hypothetical protein